MNRTKIPYLDFTWNPLGFGCSKRCDGCWAKRLAPRVGKNIGCPDCAAFRPHVHPERLDQPRHRKKPAVIGVQFTGELFDRAQPDESIRAVLDAARKAGVHDYVFLTQQPQRAAACIYWYRGEIGGFWHMGVTARDQPEADEAVPKLLAIPGRHWLSIEPIRGPVDLSYNGLGLTCPSCGGTGEITDPSHPMHPRQTGDAKDQTWCLDCNVDPAPVVQGIDGVIVGSDNRPGRPFSLAWVRDIVDQCRTAGVPVFVKQLTLLRCDECWTVAERSVAMGDHCPDCRVGRLRLACVTDPLKFPADLQIRELPWALTTKGKRDGAGHD